MYGLMKKAGLGIALTATTLSVAAPANAQRYYRHYGNRGGDTAAAAIIGGVIGLGLGAAIASNNNGYYNRGYYYDRGYYPQYRAYPRYRGYYQAPPRAYYRNYYGGGYNDRGYYDRGYYGNGYYGY